jgi:uncharacterized protein YjbI with pentapeptide repeats
MQDPNGLEAIETRALEAAANASTLDELNTAASMLKALADTRQSFNADAKSRRDSRVSLFQSVSALLVPIVSAIGVVVTLLVALQQIRATSQATNQQIEDTEWRELLNSFKGPSDQVYNDVTIAPRLQSFWDSKTYGREAKVIAIRLMGRLSSPDGFRDLFNEVFSTVDESNVGDVVEVSRELVRSQRNLEESCYSIAGDAKDSKDMQDCYESLSEKQVATREAAARKAHLPDESTIEAKRRSLHDLFSEEFEVSNRLGSFLRAEHHVLDLSNVNMFGIDLSNADLSGDNISGAIFDDVDLTDSNLTVKESDYAEFRNSDWWDAKQISGALLLNAIKYYNPASVPLWNPKHRISRSRYMQKVKALCAAANVKCPTPVFGPTPVG